MIEYLKKNKDLLLVGILIIVLVCIQYRGRLKEGFESTVANSVSVIETKFNQAFGVINADNVVMNQSLTVKKGIKSDIDIVATNNIISGKDVKTPGAILTKAGNLYLSGHIKKIGGDEAASLTTEIIKKMKSRLDLAGYAVDGGGSTHLLFADGLQNLTGGAKMDFSSNDKWDVIYLFKGWKGEFWGDSDGKGTKWTHENKDRKLQKFKYGKKSHNANKISSYKITWISY